MFRKHGTTQGSVVLQGLKAEKRIRSYVDQLQAAEKFSN